MHVQPVLRHGLHKAAVAVHDAAGGIDRTDKSDLFHSSLQKHLRHLVHSVEIIRDHRVICQFMVVKIQEHHRYGHRLPQPADVLLVDFPDDDQSLHLVLEHHLRKLQMLSPVSVLQRFDGGIALLFRGGKGQLLIEFPVIGRMISQIPLRNQHADLLKILRLLRFGPGLSVVLVSQFLRRLLYLLPQTLAYTLLPGEGVVYCHRTDPHRIGNIHKSYFTHHFLHPRFYYYPTLTKWYSRLTKSPCFEGTR